MNILWLSHLIPYPPKGGVLQRSYHLLRELARYHTVDLIAFNQKDLMAPFYQNQMESISAAEKELGSFCRNICFLPIHSNNTRFGKYFLALKSLLTKDPYTINWLKSLEYHKQVDLYIKSYRYDLIHLDTISLIPYMMQFNNIPMVLDHHNIESHMLLRRADNQSNLFKKWYFGQEGKRLETIEKNVCGKFKLNITCSEVDAIRLKKIAPSCNVVEVPNGVDIDYFESKHISPTNETRLIFVGTLNWYPNIEAVRFIAYEIWPKVKTSIPGIKVDIIGANPPRDITRLAEKEKDFYVHGFVDDVREYIERAGIYVCPINDGGGTKLKILDAFAMQKAVIADPIACEGIAVEEGKNVLFAQNVDEYVTHIKRLITNPQERNSLGKNARQLIEERYSYQMIGKKLSSLYESCIDLDKK